MSFSGDPAQSRLAYLLVSSPMAGIFMGGVMVVDGWGLPVEFRYSEPIVPTKMQQVLYGALLSQYLKHEVILETLLKSLEQTPDCILVADDSFLQFAGKGLPASLGKCPPLIRLSETKMPSIGLTGMAQVLSSRECLIQITQENPPLRFQLADDCLSSPDALPEILTKIAQAGQHLDLMEPLSRVERALEAIAQEDGLLATPKGR